VASAKNESVYLIHFYCHGIVQTTVLAT